MPVAGLPESNRVGAGTGADSAETAEAARQTLRARYAAQLSQLTQRARHLTQLVQAVQAKSETLDTAQGVSLLQLKLHTLLTYCAHLGVLAKDKTGGDSIKRHPARLALCEQRTVYEKIRPMEQKLRYQITKLLQQHAEHLAAAAAAAAGSAGSAADAATAIAGDRTDASAETKAMARARASIGIDGSDIRNPDALPSDGDSDDDDEEAAKHYRPRPEQMHTALSRLADQATAATDAGDSASSGDDGDAAAARKPSAAYRPPMLTPMTFRERDVNAAIESQRVVSERSRKSLARSRLMADLATELGSKPEEASASGMGLSKVEIQRAFDAEEAALRARGAIATGVIRDRDEREAYETENYTRVNLTRAERKQEKRLEEYARLGRFDDGLGDLEADLDRLAGVTRKAEKHRALGTGSGSTRGASAAGKRRKASATAPAPSQLRKVAKKLRRS